MFYTIYKTTNLIDQKFYIGKHQTIDLEDGYLGSGKLLKRAIEKYGKENFKKEILHIFQTEAEMNAKEKELVVLSENSYNLCEGGHGGFRYVNREIWSPEKRLEHNKHICPFNKKYNAEHKIDIMRGAIKGGLKRKAMCEQGLYDPRTFLGKKHSEEAKQRMSVSHIGKHDGIKNSQYGTCWITNGIENKKIKEEILDTWLKLGYNRGRVTLI